MKLKTKIALLEHKPKKRCRYCWSTEDLTYDHKLPIVQGGLDELSNIQVLCKSCNQAKSGMSDGTVRFLFDWFCKIQETRIANGKKQYTRRKGTV